jgi:hypothetical protein
MPKQEDETYIVEFLIVKRVKVTTHDEIQAEIEAYRKLTDRQRDSIHQIRVMYEDGKPVSGTNNWYSPDVQWLKGSV